MSIHPRTPRRSRVFASFTLAGLAAVAITSCAASASKTPTASSPSSTPAYTPDTADPAAATTAPSTSPTDDTTGSVGDTFTVTSDDGTSYEVTLIKVIDPARGSDEFNQADNGKHLVGAVFSITGESGHSSDDANNDAVLIGSDGQEYDSDFNTIAGYTDFDAGDWNVSPGSTVKGAVTFQVPDAVKVASIQWGGMFGGTPATWNN